MVARGPKSPDKRLSTDAGSRRSDPQGVAGVGGKWPKNGRGENQKAGEKMATNHFSLIAGNFRFVHGVVKP